MASPRSVRLDDDVLARLGALARARQTSVSSTIERLLDEALRREAHPGITFRDGPAGRRAGLVAGPDVHDVVRLLRDVRAEGFAGDLVAEVADLSGLDARQVRQVVAYYADHRAEIDGRLDDDDAAAAELEAAWERQQDVLRTTTR